MSKGVSKFHHVMVDLEPTVAYNHPPFYNQKGGVVGQGEGGRKTEVGGFVISMNLRVTVTFI